MLNSTLQNIKALRTKAGLSQSVFARQLGMKQGTVSRWELGLAMPCPASLLRIAEFFNVTIEELCKAHPEEKLPKRVETTRSMLMGANIRRLRKARGWSILGLSVRLGVAEGIVSSWERSGIDPEDPLLQNLMDEFGCELDDLIMEEC